MALGALLVVSNAPLCPTAFFFGVPCPGCGLTRATLALLHGDLHAALRFHPLVPVLAPWMGAIVGQALLEYVRGTPPAPPERAWWARRTARWLAGALFALLIGVWLARFAGYFGGPVPVESFRERALTR